ncbi:MacS family sensor histidine kinase [Nocardioides taihuensis]|uniref:MacS family sensor histidine kinase n=1 Tax=Nocardioides taihuensis TaxID=1835606 RepID=A0ABW0BNK9_9ACTN
MGDRRLWSRPALDVEDRLFRALAILRVVVLLNAIALNIYRAPGAEHPAALAGVVAVMVVWTVVAIWAYAEPRRRTPALLVADLAIATATILVSPVVKGPGMEATIGGFWIIGALLAWAVHWNWRGGLVASVVLAVADLSVRDHVSQGNYGNTFLLLIGGPIVGFLAESLQMMASERDAAQRATVAAEERARLARAVHDGVLQVLALVQRRGRELGGEAAELGRLAGEQESVLRRLIREQDAVPSGPAGATEADLTSALAGLESDRVTVATTGAPVLLDTRVVDEVVAAARACLDNVERHVGPGAAAWVLLETLPDEVVVSVRDEGPGIPDGRLAAAAADGRLGVAESITGRLCDLGGEAVLTTGPTGSEWELRVPLRAG